MMKYILATLALLQAICVVFAQESEHVYLIGCRTCTVIADVPVQSINQSILFAQNVQRYTYKAIQLRAGQQG